MTHIDNIPHIIKNGLTHKSSNNSNKNYIPIGDSSLINTRDGFLLDNGDHLGDYIPFYFSYRTPMLYVIQKGYNGVTPINPKDIVYCVTNVQEVLSSNIDFIYTDGHATDKFSKFYSRKNISGIKNQLDFNAINATFWKDENDLDLKRKKEAEFLIKQDLSYDRLLGFITFDKSSKKKILKIDRSCKIGVRPHFYFK